jgi:hypothetical protein
MSTPADLTPDLVLTTYRGSPINFVLTPDQGGSPSQIGSPIEDLADYDQITLHVRTGSRESPGPVALAVKYTGDAPNYVSVVDVTIDSVAYPSVSVSVPAAASGGLTAGQYYAELWVTPAGGEATFTGWLVWNHEQTSYGV